MTGSKCISRNTNKGTHQQHTPVLKGTDLCLQAAELGIMLWQLARARDLI
jgi:hypothetical protein